MVDSRQKGARAETIIRDKLRELTGLLFERTPGSGSLSPTLLMKGDLFIPGINNNYCIECKHYEDDHLTSILLTGKSPQLITFWEQTVKQGKQVNKIPLLIFKFDRSKIFVAFEEMPTADYRYLYFSGLGYEFYMALLYDWILNEQPQFI